MLPIRTFARTAVRHYMKRSASPLAAATNSASTNQRSTQSQASASFSTTSAAMAEFKLKGLSSLDLKVGEKREVEVEGLEEGKVLLVNVGGKTTALGNKCTHYGAPLVKGVLSPEGRLSCPWHGACFNATNGDIENAPALDHLPTFKLTEKDGAVFIEGEKDTIKGSRRKPNVKCSAKGPEKVVIVGGGTGATGALQTLRDQGFDGSITMITSEGYLPIDRTKLSKALIDDPAKIALRDEAWFKEAGVATVMDEVTDVDFDGKKVSTKNGSSYPYSKLILAPGGSPNMLPLDGFKELKGIFLLRTISHVKEILAAIGDGGKKIVVIGSSFIGMEVANATAKKNTVTVVGQEKRPLERIMGEKVGKIFQDSLEKNGVKFYMEAGVEKALPSESDSLKVGSIQLKGGDRLECDLVILGAGVKPATTFLKDNKAVELLKDGSLKVNEHFEVEGQKGVYALGDIATFPYHGPGGNGSSTRIEHYDVAMDSGRYAAMNILSPSSEAKVSIPVFWSALGSQLRYCGNTPNGWDDLVLKGQPEESKFVAYYCKGEVVVAVGSMQMDPYMTQSAELMRRGKMPSKSELEKGVDIMEVSLPAGVQI